MKSSENPLRSNSPTDWDRLIESVNPASILVVVRSRMGRLVSSCSAEDIWHEVLMQVWRDRRQIEWRGLKCFRSFLLTMVDNRIKDGIRRECATKRGAGETVHISTLAGGDSRDIPCLGADSTTASRLEIYKEQALVMERALDALHDGLREVLRARLFEQKKMREVANELGLSPSGARDRFLRALEKYRQLLTSSGVVTESRYPDPPESRNSG